MIVAESVTRNNEIVSYIIYSDSNVYLYDTREKADRNHRLHSTAIVVYDYDKLQETLQYYRESDLHLINDNMINDYRRIFTSCDYVLSRLSINSFETIKVKGVEYQQGVLFT